MGFKTKIEWCDATINPVVGCKNNCEYCYARKLNDRFHFVKDFGKPQFFPERLEQLNRKKPKIIFMNSMSDVADWEPEWIRETVQTIIGNNQHEYLFLTKNPSIYYNNLFACNHIWHGATVTGEADFYERTKELHNATSGYNRRILISFEPIFSPMPRYLSPQLNHLAWLILGAETGNRKGKVVPKKEWIDDIVKQAKEYDIPVFMKNSLKEIMGADFLQEFPEELKKERDSK